MISPQFSGFSDTRPLPANEALPTAWIFSRGTRPPVSQSLACDPEWPLRWLGIASTRLYPGQLAVERGEVPDRHHLVEIRLGQPVEQPAHPGRGPASQQERCARIPHPKPAAGKNSLQSPRLWYETPDSEDGAPVWVGAPHIRRIL